MPCILDPRTIVGGVTPDTLDDNTHQQRRAFVTSRTTTSTTAGPAARATNPPRPSAPLRARQSGHTSGNIARGRIPEIRLSMSAEITPSDVIVVPVISGNSGPEVPVSGQLGEQAQVELWKSVVDAGVTGRAEETALLPGVAGVSAARILVVGLGPLTAVNPEVVRQAAGNASRVATEQSVIPATTPSTTPATLWSLLGDLSEGVPHLDHAEVLAAAVEGHGLGGYRYPGSDMAPVLTIQAPEYPEIPPAFTRSCVVVEAVTCARDLVNAPADILFPESYAELIDELGTASGVDVEIFDEEDLTLAGFGGLVGVGQGSRRGPRLVRMHYLPEDAVTDLSRVPRLALVGKGVTFDTGGISLKQAAGMDHMISDMGGSAAVVATVLAVAELGLPVEVIATLPLAENMPDGDALRPGDIVTHYGGTTSEILNTDAEGRLILGDALARAVEDAPDLIVDAATLTGAQVASLGDRITAVMGTPELRDRIVHLGTSVGEDAWPMPLPAEIAQEIRSDVADLRNTGTTKWGGMAAAGHYLAHFVPADVPWAHLDIAGPAFETQSAHGYIPKRATGVPVRTLIALVEDIART